MTSEELQNFCLVEIENLLQNNGKSLKDYAGMPVPNVNSISHFSNSMVINRNGTIQPICSFPIFDGVPQMAEKLRRYV
ncbi:hypothetical protein Ahy_B03g062095 [Arachis hypogaea]|uniref:Uncharacterized protein n=1 Tax=Arachis hypogaea TaxID=3818 RepID=A0A444ZSY8_ARAHY|nr:hypothetical protein Ahy_B03g062095 [Arachis hypogaea]